MNNVFVNSGSILEFDVSYRLFHFKDKNEEKQLFMDVNDAVPITPEEKKNLCAEPSVLIKDHLNKKYKSHMKTSAKPKFPNCRTDDVVTLLLDRFGSDCENVVEELEKWNDSLGLKLRDSPEAEDRESYEEAREKQGFFLAHLLRPLSASASAISPGVRKRLWQIKANDEGRGNCFCCGREVFVASEDYFKRFQAGHIVSKYSGGSDDIANLEVLCAICNRDMGTEYLHDYKSRYYSSQTSHIANFRQ
jgi:hypothetical protein